MIEACLLHQGTEFCSYLRRRFFSPLNRGFAQGWPLPNGPEKRQTNLVKSQQTLTKAKRIRNGSIFSSNFPIYDTIVTFCKSCEYEIVMLELQRGHSTTTWTDFCQSFNAPSPMLGQFLYPERGQNRHFLTPSHLFHVVIEWPLSKQKQF